MNDYMMLSLLLLGYMTLWFLVSIIKKRNDVADIAWGLGCVLLTWSSFFLSGEPTHRSILVGVLVSIWGLRLAWHIYHRNKGKTEDYRYLAWRKSWGKWFLLRSYLQVYLLQGILLFITALPILLINQDDSKGLYFLDFFGLTIWMLGFFFEAVSDSQLARFKSNPSNNGKLLQNGLWRYSRHPNYFGEIMQWWGVWFIAINTVYGWLALIGPITITTLILKVSGIPLLEQKMRSNPDFSDYEKKTNQLIPWIPK